LLPCIEKPPVARSLAAVTRDLKGEQSVEETV
jgi:hypothetical protein